MTPSSWICKALYRCNPKLRLAWHGRERTENCDINAGNFALVQLFPAQVVGPLHDPNIYSELWDITPRLNQFGVVEMTKINRGPIFNRHGGTTRDWDPITQVPVYLIDLEGLGFDKYRVLNGEFLLYLPRWQTSAKKRLKASLEERYKDHKREINDLSREAGDYLWSRANNTGATAPVVDTAQAHAETDKFFQKTPKVEKYYSLKDEL